MFSSVFARLAIKFWEKGGFLKKMVFSSVFAGLVVKFWEKGDFLKKWSFLAFSLG